ncbi:MAG: flavin reductase family protein [Candidatus Diapherotrites archaeon]|nr:flavin reductase family protein [Candidatus Diapherotrites archaeon]
MKKEFQLGQLINLFPSPVVLVGSRDSSGKNNVMTAAWFGVLCSVPPYLGVSIRPSRLTNRAIKESKCFSINIPEEKILEKVDLAGIISGCSCDKFKDIGLTLEEAKKINAPLVKECPISYECELKEIISLGTHDLFIGEVKLALVDENLLEDSKLKTQNIKALLLFSNEYFGVGNKLASYGFKKK